MDALTGLYARCRKRKKVAAEGAYSRPYRYGVCRFFGLLWPGPAILSLMRRFPACPSVASIFHPLPARMNKYFQSKFTDELSDDSGQGGSREWTEFCVCYCRFDSLPFTLKMSEDGISGKDSDCRIII
jgi:hypothetical protein